MQKDPPSNPHQQYLLWAVESGVVGAGLFLAMLFFQFKAANTLQTGAGQTLITLTVISFILGIMNCPYFGAGMGECLVYLSACILAMRDRYH
jgi:O-antigen ligase